MSFDWGGFGSGLMTGAEKGAALGEKIGDAWRKHKYAERQEEIDRDYDNRRAALQSDYGVIDAMNKGEDPQAAVSAASGATPIARPAGVTSIAQLDDDGAWRPMAGAGDVKSTPSAPDWDRYERTYQSTLQDRLADLDAERQRAVDMNYMRYVATDPKEAMAFRKEMRENEFKRGLQQTFVGALNGDPKALTSIIQYINQHPEYAGFNKGDKIVAGENPWSFNLVNKDGKVVQGNVPLTRSLLEDGFKMYAIGKRFEFDSDIDKYLARGEVLDKPSRERAKMEMESGDRRAKMSQDAWYQQQRLALEQAKLVASQAGSGKAAKWEADPNDMNGGRVLIGMRSSDGTIGPIALAGPHGENLRPANFTEEAWTKLGNLILSKGYQLAMGEGFQPIVVTKDGSAYTPLEEFLNRGGSVGWRRMEDSNNGGPAPVGSSPVAASQAAPASQVAPAPRGTALPANMAGRTGAAPQPVEQGTPSTGAPERAQAVSLPTSSEAQAPGRQRAGGNRTVVDAIREGWEDLRAALNESDKGNQERFKDYSGLSDKSLETLGRHDLTQKGMHESDEARLRGRARGQEEQTVPQAKEPEPALAPKKEEPAAKSAKRDAEPAKKTEPARSKAVELPVSKATTKAKPVVKAEPAKKVAPVEKKAPAKKQAVSLPVTSVKPKAAQKPAEEPTKENDLVIDWDKPDPDLAKLEWRKPKAGSSPVEGVELLDSSDGSKGVKEEGKSRRRFAAPVGSDVRSTTDGTVVGVVPYMRGYGSVVIVEDTDGNQHAYGNTKSSMKLGTKVSKGTPIGKVGNQWLSGKNEGAVSLTSFTKQRISKGVQAGKNWENSDDAKQYSESIEKENRREKQAQAIELAKKKKKA